MEYKGDFNTGDVVRCPFNTLDNTGVLTTLAGTPAVKVYKNGDAASEVTTGVTLTVDFDGTTGSHFLSIDTSSDATFYSPGSEFSAKITAGTVGGVSVVGKWLCSWSIRNRVGVIIPNGRGTAAAAGVSTITLQTALGANNNAYCCTIAIVSGTGVGQQRVIVGYVNGTKVATVDRAWDTALDTTSKYEIYAIQTPAMSSGQGFIFGVASTLNAKLVSFDTGVLDTIAASVWNALTSGITTTGSIGKYVIDYLFGASTSQELQDAKNEILADIDGLGSDITVVSPLSSDGTRLELVQGDSYSTINGRSLTFSITGQAGLIGSVAHLRIADTVADLATSATIASGTQTVTFSDITTTQTAALIAGNHKYQIRFIEGSDKATPIQGVCVVKAGL